MLNRIKSFIRENCQFQHSELHLVGLSGGADSVALLMILKELGYRVEAAHCNFRLRGDESDRDEMFVRELCKKHDVKLHVIHFDTKSYAELHQVSIEMAARDLRYGYFRQLCQDIGATDVCIAHHRDDAVETLLMNLLRGAGIHGLTGIRPRNGIIRRPLLCVSRQEILDYLESRGQDYITDSTNLIDDVLRNKIRLRVLPLLEEIAPGATANIDKTAHYLCEAEKVYQSAIDSELSACHPRRVSVAQLLQQPSPSSFLHEWLAPLGFNSTQTEQLLDCLEETGREFLSATHVLIVDRGELLVEPVREPMKPMKIPECGTYRHDESTTYTFELTADTTVSRAAHVATVDASDVRFPLMLRPIEQGDKFVPFGMNGHKLVSDYMTDQKLSVFEKRRQLLLVDADGRVLWLVGRRTDDRFKITPQTTQVLRITQNK